MMRYRTTRHPVAWSVVEHDRSPLAGERGRRFRFPVRAAWIVAWWLGVTAATWVASGPTAPLWASDRSEPVVWHYRFDNASHLGADRSRPALDAIVTGRSARRVLRSQRPARWGLRIDAAHQVRTQPLDKPIDQFTLSLWVRLRAAPTESLAAIYAADDWRGGYLHLNLRRDGGVEVAINGQSTFPQSPTETIPVGRWIHLALVYDGKSGRVVLYRNSRQVVQAVGMRKLPVRFPAGAYGAWYRGRPSRVLPADVAELRLVAVPLSPDEIRRQYLDDRGVPQQLVDYAQTIRPILAARCASCHTGEESESGLHIDVRDSMLRGGESGEPAVVPFASDESELMRRITAPHGDERAMPPEEPRLNSQEIESLRTWIDQGARWPDRLAGKMVRRRVTTEHWSFQPIQQPAVPVSADDFVRSGNPIDAFVSSRLREHGLAPSPRADRRTLIRRLYLDVHGLPPSPEEVTRFIEDRSPDAWTRLVDRVLANPHYGERWASHWLDVIRYADTHGFEVNTPRADAWPYRDYVIKSLNDDKPYDQFLREQIIGDQLGADAATGFLVAAPALLPGQVGKDEPSQRQARADALHEVIISVGSGMLGLTVGCARCHPHKFDPITQRDYYRLQGFFAGLRYGSRPVADNRHFRLGAAASKTVYAGMFSTPEPTFRLYRGDPMQRRERLAPDVPAVFGSLGLESSASDAARRRALADWLSDPHNPLPARVIVNRIWQHHFGRGIVATPSDFGAMGVPPTHPRLLDWLAAELSRSGWSLKRIHRLILTSNTYCQSSRPRAAALQKDGHTEWLWRFPPHRLEMEAIRDSILAVSGSLDQSMGGPGFSLFKPNSNYVRVYDPKEEWGPAEWRRMVYSHRVRMERDGVFGVFDCPDAGQPAPRRARSTTPLQALSLLHSSFLHQQARRFARRIEREAGEDRRRQIERAFEIAYGRQPTADEQKACLAVWQELGLAAVCLALFNSNEFLRIE